MAAANEHRCHVIIVGGGIGGASCAASLASLASEESAESVRITVISQSPVVPVTTPGESRFELNVDFRRVETWSRQWGVEVVSDTAVALHERHIVLASGTVVPFDVCCVATGARPKIPSWFKAATSDVLKRLHVVRDADSVRRLRNTLKTCRRVVVVGNGGIAMELVYEVTSCDVTWVIKDKHIGNSFFDEGTSSCLAGFLGRRNSRAGKLLPFTSPPHEEDSASGALSGSGVGPDWLGIKEKPTLFPEPPQSETRVLPEPEAFSSSHLDIQRECFVQSVGAVGGCSMSAWPLRVDLSSGSVLYCDAVVCAIGVEPNVEWLGPNCDLVKSRSSPDVDVDSDVNNGVAVLPLSMRSLQKRNVFAVGDCSTVQRTEDMSPENGNNWFQMRLWTQAATSGRIAARAILGEIDEAFDERGGLEAELFAHSTSFFGQRVVLLGRYNAQGLRPGYEVIEKGDGETFIRVVLSEGRARGALLIGNVDLSETYENLILDGLDLRHIPRTELVDPTIDLDDYFD